MKDEEKLEDKSSTFLGLSASQIRGGLLLLPLILILSGVFLLIKRTRVEDSFLVLTDTLSGEQYASRSDSSVVEGELFVFDPNTIDYQGLRRLGFSATEASGLIRYRTLYEKIFILPTDFAACYQVSDSMFNRLEPYIKIDAEIKVRVKASSVTEKSTSKAPQAESEEHPAELSYFDPNVLDSLGFMRLGFSSAQVRVILNYRRSIDYFETPEAFGKCYVVKDRFDELKPYIRIQPRQADSSKVGQPEARLIELNSATFDQLVAVKGIGELTARRIIEYRERLGGYVAITQLSEVEGVIKKNYDVFSEYFFVKNDGISKIDVNFANSEIMSKHPYLTGLMIRKILKHKQLKGGLSTIEEMIEEEILTKAEADKLSDYLVFTTIQPN